ncbi:MAG TPA: trypsin-like peptidase domain-containing protein [Candidatus Limnocylindrales bacterium]|jgi:serine protease Do|nr:trypsin-like peptidase domain-containing protein [Candidatus Limnocylindrales bacterium]
MLKKCFLPFIFASGIIPILEADTIQLKDKASIVGKVLAEKHDQVAVDVGYTVLVIPRNQIVKVSRTDEGAEASTKPVVSKKVVVDNDSKTDGAAITESLVGFYSMTGRPLPARSVRDLVNQLGEAVVQVRTPSGLGSGFIINEDGFLMTNFHVIEGETQISVEVYHQAGGELERKSYKQVRIIAINKFADLALLKIEEKGAPKFKFVLLGSADALAVGESVFAIGSPLGLERTVTEGILSTKTRPMAGELYLQTTTQINPGNSGGPLFNLRGEVVGITNMKITFGEGLGFAIPVEALKYFLDHRDAFAYSNDNPGNAYRYLAPPSRTQKTTIEE